MMRDWLQGGVGYNLPTLGMNVSSSRAPADLAPSR